MFSFLIEVIVITESYQTIEVFVITESYQTIVYRGFSVRSILHIKNIITDNLLC